MTDSPAASGTRLQSAGAILLGLVVVVAVVALAIGARMREDA